jgi:2-methylcitrate dehydratase PrpD
LHGSAVTRQCQEGKSELPARVLRWGPRTSRYTSDIRNLSIRTHDACIRIIDKKAPLSNRADSDHCIQCMVAMPLLFGRRTAADH